MNRFCGNCGNPISGHERFCGKCGAKVEAAGQEETGKVRETIIPTASQMGQNAVPVEKMLKLSAAAVSALMILSTFLPYIDVMGETSSFWGMSADSVLVTGLGILGIVFAVLGKKIPLLAVGVLSFLMGAYERHSVKKTIESTWIFASYITKKSGYYLLAVMSVLLLIVCLLYFFRNHVEAAVSKNLK